MAANFINTSGNIIANSGNFTTLTINGTSINNFNENIDDRINSLLVAGTGINLSYNDNSNALTINLASSVVSGYEVLSSGKSIFTVSQGYLSNNLNVYVNGSKLILGEDYTASNGSTFTLTQTAASGDIIEWQGLGGPAAYSELNHTHGNISNSGTIGSTSNLPLITTTNGAITVGSFGSSANTFCQGNDSRLSDTRTPTNGSVTSEKIADANVTFAKLQSATGVSVIGRSANSAGVYAEIVAGTDGHVLRRSGTTVGFGTIATASIADDSVTYAKLQNVSTTDRLLGRSSAGAGDVEEITCTAFGRSLIDDADAAAARTTLGVQPTASPTFTGTVTVPGLTATAAILADDLTSSNSVVYSFDGDPNTGIGRAGADILTCVTAGAERVRVDASGNVVVGPQGVGSAVSAPIYLQLGRQVADTAGIASKTKLRTYEDSGGNIFGFGVSSGLFETHVSTGASFAWYVNNTERFRISSDGTVTALDVYEDTVGATNRDLFIDNTGKLGYVSSIRASKAGITAIEDVSWLRDLTPVSFFYRRRNEDGTYSDEPDGTLDYGLIAEDVEVVAPELCFYDIVDDNPELRGIHYSKLITPMLKYIQQLEDRIASLETRLGDNV